jgi:hypothetical protein
VSKSEKCGCTPLLMIAVWHHLNKFNSLPPDVCPHGNLRALLPSVNQMTIRIPDDAPINRMMKRKAAQHQPPVGPLRNRASERLVDGSGQVFQRRALGDLKPARTIAGTPVQNMLGGIQRRPSGPLGTPPIPARFGGIGPQIPGPGGRPLYQSPFSH